MKHVPCASMLTCLLFLAVAGSAHADAVDDFHLAIAQGDVGAVKRALGKDADLVNRRNPNGFTPLFQAAIQGRTAIAELLLDRGAQVDAKVLGETPLFRACFRGDVKTAALLLDRGANVEAAND